MSLAGRGVLVTRPRGLAEAYAEALERRGARAIVFPAIEIHPLPAPPALRRAADYDLVIFVSPSAVRVAAPCIAAWPAMVAAIGSGTRRELERAGAARIVAPRVGADSEALLAELAGLAGKRVLIVRGEGGRTVLGDTLKERGAAVEYAECYRRVRPSADPQPVLAAWRHGELHAVVVSSAEGFDNLLDMLGGALLRATPVFVPHRRVAEHALARVQGDVQVAGPGDDETIERLVAYFDGRA
jgi:uroporphyrinogen-III synthase